MAFVGQVVNLRPIVNRPAVPVNDRTAAVDNRLAVKHPRVSGA
jgi:hypothetical protein